VTTVIRDRARRFRRVVLLAAASVFVVAGVLVADATLRPAGSHRPPPADAEPGRWVLLEGAANTRDAGGYATADGRRVRRGMVYRSATLAGLTPAGVETFRKLGIQSVLDLRNRLTPWPPFNGDPWGVFLSAAVHGCPMSFAKTDPPCNVYIRGVRENAASFREAFTVLSRAESYPVLYHCAAGKDRTGVLTALLLSMLGVEREMVLAEFRLSEQVGMPGSRAALEALLDEVEDRGGIRVFLADMGISMEAQERIRSLLLESPNSSAGLSLHAG
jgi:protein-tyrosine phosphatase